MPKIKIDPLNPDRYHGLTSGAALDELSPHVVRDRDYLERDIDILEGTGRLRPEQSAALHWADGIVKNAPRNGLANFAELVAMEDPATQQPLLPGERAAVQDGSLWQALEWDSPPLRTVRIPRFRPILPQTVNLVRNLPPKLEIPPVIKIGSIPALTRQELEVLLGNDATRDEILTAVQRVQQIAGLNDDGDINTISLLDIENLLLTPNGGILTPEVIAHIRSVKALIESRFTEQREEGAFHPELRTIALRLARHYTGERWPTELTEQQLKTAFKDYNLPYLPALAPFLAKDSRAKLLANYQEVQQEARKKPVEFHVFGEIELRDLPAHLGADIAEATFAAFGPIELQQRIETSLSDSAKGPTATRTTTTRIVVPDGYQAIVKDAYTGREIQYSAGSHDLKEHLTNRVEEDHRERDREDDVSSFYLEVLRTRDVGGQIEYEVESKHRIHLKNGPLRIEQNVEHILHLKNQIRGLGRIEVKNGPQFEQWNLSREQTGVPVRFNIRQNENGDLTQILPTGVYRLPNSSRELRIYSDGEISLFRPAYEYQGRAYAESETFLAPIPATSGIAAGHMIANFDPPGGSYRLPAGAIIATMHPKSGTIDLQFSDYASATITLADRIR